MTSAVDDFEEIFQIVARRLLAGEGAEEDGKLCNELFVFEHVIGNAPGIDGGPPPPKGVVRIPLHEGSWVLQPVDGGKRTHAIYKFRMELGGHLPMWMARGRAGKDVPDLIQAIRSQVQFYR